MPTYDPYSAPAEPSPATPSPAELANHQAAQLLTHFNVAKPAPDGYEPGVGMPDGSDIPKPSGLYTRSLIGPTAWPSESENAFRQASKDWKAFQRRHEDAAESTKSMYEHVFSQAWTAGDGADAAREHYGDQYRKHLNVVDVAEAGAGMYRRLGTDIERTKRLIRDAHDAAHRDIEAYLQAPGGKSIATVGTIIAPYRTLIESYSGDLRDRDSAEMAGLAEKFGPTPKAPADPGGRTGQHHDMPTAQSPDEDDKSTERPAEKGVDQESDTTSNGYHHDLPTPTATEPADTGGGSSDISADGDAPGRELGLIHALPSSATMLPASLPTTTGVGRAGGSSLGGMASGSAGSPGMFGRGAAVSPVSGLGSSAAGGPAAGAAAVSPPPLVSGASSASLGEQFGRGVAVGSGAAGAVPPLSAPPPQAPRTPLAAPMVQSAPGLAAPAGVSGAVTSPGASAAAVGGGVGSVPVPAPPAGAVASAAGSAAGGGGVAATPMTSYGSVLPPAAGPAAVAGGGVASSIAGAPPPPPITGGAGSNTAPGFVPVREQFSPLRIGRDVSMTDLEVARAAVADLAAASSVVYPGLEWAVAVSRGSAGTPELWVTSNEGAGYIPLGVYLPRTMPLAARFDDAFDARWTGWFNPAETAVRAVRARGGTVSAVATSWARTSDLVAEATPDVAIAVAPSSGPGEAGAAQLLSSRSHRLETVAPGVYHGLKAGRSVAEAYARAATQAVAFHGVELSAVAQSVARAVVSASRRPGSEEWAALRAEYERERLIAGSQRPGLDGVEQPEQLLAYLRDFVHCRRLETLLCWQDSSPADVVYAAAMAGAALPPVPAG